MTVASTSKQAFGKLQRKLGIKQMNTYRALKKLGRSTDLELSEYMNEPINSTVARRNELVHYGYVKEDGRKFNRTGNTAKAWVAVEPAFEKIKRIIRKEAEVVDCY